MFSISRCLVASFAFVGLTDVGRAAEIPPAPPAMDSAQIRLALEKLNVLGRVLYVAAHPDDENTSLISYWANGALYDTAYLSLTRGDGGQNLIGPELRDQLGVIRTEELLAARRSTMAGSSSPARMTSASPNRPTKLCASGTGRKFSRMLFGLCGSFSPISS
jgi:hypothetical protein